MAENRGFAAMDEQRQKEIASKGGQSQGRENNSGNFANDPERASEAGRMQGKDNNPGNFANDPERASEAGRKGGQH